MPAKLMNTFAPNPKDQEIQNRMLETAKEDTGGLGTTDGAVATIVGERKPQYKGILNIKNNRSKQKEPEKDTETGPSADFIEYAQGEEVDTGARPPEPAPQTGRKVIDRPHTPEEQAKMAEEQAKMPGIHAEVDEMREKGLEKQKKDAENAQNPEKSAENVENPEENAQKQWEKYEVQSRWDSPWGRGLTMAARLGTQAAPDALKRAYGAYGAAIDLTNALMSGKPLAIGAKMLDSTNASLGALLGPLDDGWAALGVHGGAGRETLKNEIAVAGRSQIFELEKAEAMHKDLMSTYNDVLEKHLPEGHKPEDLANLTAEQAADVYDSMTEAMKQRYGVDLDAIRAKQMRGEKWTPTPSERMLVTAFNDISKQMKTAYRDGNVRQRRELAAKRKDLSELRAQLRRLKGDRDSLLPLAYVEDPDGTFSWDGEAAKPFSWDDKMKVFNYLNKIRMDKKGLGLTEPEQKAFDRLAYERENYLQAQRGTAEKRYRGLIDEYNANGPGTIPYRDLMSMRALLDQDRQTGRLRDEDAPLLDKLNELYGTTKSEGRVMDSIRTNHGIYQKNRDRFKSQMGEMYTGITDILAGRIIDGQNSVQFVADYLDTPEKRNAAKDFSDYIGIAVKNQAELDGMGIEIDPADITIAGNIRKALHYKYGEMAVETGGFTEEDAITLAGYDLSDRELRDVAYQFTLNMSGGETYTDPSLPSESRQKVDEAVAAIRANHEQLAMINSSLSALLGAIDDRTYLRGDMALVGEALVKEVGELAEAKRDRTPYPKGDLAAPGLKLFIKACRAAKIGGKATHLLIAQLAADSTSPLYKAIFSTELDDDERPAEPPQSPQKQSEGAGAGAGAPEVPKASAEPSEEPESELKTYENARDAARNGSNLKFETADTGYNPNVPYGSGIGHSEPRTRRQPAYDPNEGMAALESYGPEMDAILKEGNAGSTEHFSTLGELLSGQNYGSTEGGKKLRAIQDMIRGLTGDSLAEAQSKLVRGVILDALRTGQRLNAEEVGRLDAFLKDGDNRQLIADMASKTQKQMVRAYTDKVFPKEKKTRTVDRPHTPEDEEIKAMVGTANKAKYEGLIKNHPVTHIKSDPLVRGYQLAMSLPEVGIRPESWKKFTDFVNGLAAKRGAEDDDMKDIEGALNSIERNVPADAEMYNFDKIEGSDETKDLINEAAAVFSDGFKMKKLQSLIKALSPDAKIIDGDIGDFKIDYGGLKDFKNKLDKDAAELGQIYLYQIDNKTNEGYANEYYKKAYKAYSAASRAISDVIKEHESNARSEVDEKTKDNREKWKAHEEEVKEAEKDSPSKGSLGKPAQWKRGARRTAGDTARETKTEPPAEKPLEEEINEDPKDLETPDTDISIEPPKTVDESAQPKKPSVIERFKSNSEYSDDEIKQLVDDYMAHPNKNINMITIGRPTALKIQANTGKLLRKHLGIDLVGPKIFTAKKELFKRADELVNKETGEIEEGEDKAQLMRDAVQLLRDSNKNEGSLISQIFGPYDQDGSINREALHTFTDNLVALNNLFKRAEARDGRGILLDIGRLIEIATGTYIDKSKAPKKPEKELKPGDAGYLAPKETIEEKVEEKTPEKPAGAAKQPDAAHDKEVEKSPAKTGRKASGRDSGTKTKSTTKTKELKSHAPSGKQVVVKRDAKPISASDAALLRTLSPNDKHYDPTKVMNNDNLP